MRHRRKEGGINEETKKRRKEEKTKGRKKERQSGGKRIRGGWTDLV